jgi:plasmid segregation protein ParM
MLGPSDIKETQMNGMTVRAVDVGFGNTKFTLADSTEIAGVRCDLFPSIAPQANSLQVGGGSPIANLDTVCVEVKGVGYEVGKDAEWAMPHSFTRVLDPGFFRSDKYMALLRGALNYMNVEQIDLLVVGLPVEHAVNADTRKWLEAALTGEHPLPDQRGVRVKEVWVMAQPMGGFYFNAIQEGKLEAALASMNLLIDPGYFTLDWVTARGQKMIHRRSDSFRGGVSNYLGEIARQISAKYGGQITEYTRIDEALRTGQPFHRASKVIDLTPFLPAADAVVEAAVDALAKSVGDGADIQSIVLVGGGATLFQAALRSKYPDHDIRLLDDPVFANVKGFQYAGEVKLMQRQQAVVA